MSNLFNGTRKLMVNICRSYAFKSDLKIKWNRPVKLPCIDPRVSGDGPLPEIDMKQFIPSVKDSKELQEAPERIKALYRLENSRRIHTSDLYRQMYVEEVQRHKYDYGSMEARIASMTATIRRFQQIMAEFPRNKRIKILLKEKIDKRKKFLKYLRRWDYKKFEWLLEKLDLVYKPPPPEFHWITRKDSLRKLTDKYCEDIKNERLEKYRELLESRQIPFLEEKVKNLIFIRKEQQECEVTVTVTEEEINAVKKQLEDLKAAKSAQAKVEEQ